MNISSVLDAYTLQARFLPALVLLFPAILLIAGLLPDMSQLPTMIGFGIISIALAVLATQYVRDAGKDFEKFLVKTWGGYPTTLELMYSRTTLSTVALKGYREKISQLYPDLELPSEQDEVINPDKSMQILDEAVRRSREATRDTKQFQLLYQENVSYGFRRNLVALRFFGVLSCILCSLLAAVPILAPEKVAISISYPFMYMALATSLLFLILWLIEWNVAWVHKAAQRYANQLLSSLHDVKKN